MELNFLWGLGNPVLAFLGWFVYIAFVALFSLGLLALWNHFTKKED